MKTKSAILVAALAFLLAGAADASTTITTSTGAATFTAAATSKVYNVGDADTIIVHVYGTTATTSSTTIQVSLDNSAWYTVATITNAGTTGEAWSIPPCDFIRIVVASLGGGEVLKAKLYTRGGGKQIQ